MSRSKIPAVSALFACAAASSLLTPAHAALFDVPIPPSAYITVAGNDWAWGYPVEAAGIAFVNVPAADLSYQATQGWRLPTVAEMTAAALTNTSFLKADGNVPTGGMDPATGAHIQAGSPAGPAACATPYFSADAQLLHCDWDNGPPGWPWAGLPGSDLFEEQLFIRPVPDVKVSLTGPSTATGGTTITVGATLDNVGLGDVISGTTTITLPAGLTLDAAATLPTGCSAAGTTQVACDMSAAGLGPIAAAGQAVVPIQAIVDAAPPASGTAYAVAAGMIRDLDATNDSDALAITLAALTPVAITTAGLPGGKVNSPYMPLVLAATGGTPPYTWSAAGLPPGLTLNATTGELTGAPTTAGTFTVDLTVTDGTRPTAQTATVQLQLTVSAAAVTGNVAAVPALGQWALALLGVLAAGLGLNARRKAPVGVQS